MRRLLTAVLPALLVIVAACDTDDGRELRPPTSEQRTVMSTTTTSTSTVPASVTPTTAVTTTVAQPFALFPPWTDGSAIDARFTCDGDDRSPLLRWSAPPAGTVELALLVTDDDADDFVHWAVAGIAPTAGEVGESATITGALEGTNDFGELGWSGPCPPAGGPHTYRFTMYALGQQAELPEDFAGDELLAVAAPASLSRAEATGTYQRAG